YDPAHPAVLRTLQAIIDGGRKANIPVSVCGEIAGDPIFAALLVGMGADSLSLTANSLPEVKYLIRLMDSQDAKVLVKKALQSNSSIEILELLENFRLDALGELVH
ncbi:MAG: phosphoenolpyruvate--protein phosphotransferase, partial [Opitutales bacterium]|nr:phosphoenolpyruvate--protein phosphotransferase [Opitutales bacterium]